MRAVNRGKGTLPAPLSEVSISAEGRLHTCLAELMPTKGMSCSTEISLRYGVPHALLLPISVGSSLSYFRSWDPLPRRYSPFPRVESPLTSAIHMDAFDAVDCARIMALRIRAKEDVSKSAAGQDEEEQVWEREKRARALGPKNGVTCLAVHCECIATRVPW